MKLAIFIFFIIGALVLFAFLNFPPPYANKKIVKTFNKMVLGVTFIICLVFYLSGRVNLPFSSAMREVIAFAGAVGIEIVFLTICFCLRNKSASPYFFIFSYQSFKTFDTTHTYLLRANLGMIPFYPVLRNHYRSFPIRYKLSLK